MPVKIHGKDYFTVAERLNQFIKENPKYNINTEHEVLAGAILVKAIITTPERTATGLAYEKEGSTTINKTSHVENAETSAVGRALAFLGYAGTEICSADELMNALQKQSSKGFSDVKIPLKCNDCGSDISKAEATYSAKWYMRTLCRSCQAKEKQRKQSSSANPSQEVTEEIIE